MTTQKQNKLAITRIGRTELHFLAMIRDHKVKWHIKGILREIMAN